MVSWRAHPRSLAGALLALTLALGALPAAAASAASSFTVTARAGRTTLTLGHATQLKGKVSPARPGRSVTLQQRSGKSWKTLATTKLTDTSTYAFRLAPTAAGVKAYRVVKPAQGSRSAGVSPAVKVNVYRWHYVTDLPTVAEQRVDSWDVDADIAGITVHRSVLLDANSGDGTDGGWFQTDLRGKCSTFQAQLGAAAGNPAGSTVGIKVSAEGDSSSQSMSTVFGPADSLGLELPIDRATLLEVRGVPVGDADGAALAVGSPRVLCRF